MGCSGCLVVLVPNLTGGPLGTTVTARILGWPFLDGDAVFGERGDCIMPDRN